MMTKLFLMVMGVLLTMCNWPNFWFPIQYIGVESWEEGFKKDLFIIGIVMVLFDFIWICVTGL